MSDPFEIILQESKEEKPHTAEVMLIERSGRYRIGPPLRPPIPHDGGHLARFGKRDPDATDFAARAAGLILVGGSEAFNTSITGALTTFGDMADANAAYRHFLNGSGSRRRINYERYLEGDPSGKEVLPNAFSDFKIHAEAIGKNREKFSITGNTYTVGNDISSIAAYPVTQNWRKTIGAHFIWLSADITVTVRKGKIIYSALVTINIEDMYNFNPDDKDIDTSIPDAINGRLETSELARQYINYDSIKRDIEWEKGSAKPATVKPQEQKRHRKPNDNVLPINRI